MVAREQLLKAIEQVESGGRRDAVSPKGARGRMQVMPATARQPGYRVKPARNETEEEYTRVGRDYAMALLNHYGGDLEATLVAYNYGPTNANKWIASGRNKRKLPDETRNYITKVNKQLNQRNRGIKMADTSGFSRMSPKERRSRVRQANRAIERAKSVGMKPKASDLNILKMASKADKGPITEKEMRSDRSKAAKGAIAAATVVPGIGLAAKGITSGVKAVKGARAASAAAKKLAEQKAKKAAAAKAKREAAKKAKQAQEKANAARKAREAQGRSSAGGAADDAVAQGVSAAAKKAARKKVTDAAKKKAAQQKKLAAQRKASQARNQRKPKPAANKKYQTNADGSLKLRNGKPILKKPTTAAKPKTPAKPKTDSKMVATKPGRPPITRKKALGIASVPVGAAGVYGLSKLANNRTKDISKGAAEASEQAKTKQKRTRKPKRADNSGMLFDPNLQQTTPDVGQSKQSKRTDNSGMLFDAAANKKARMPDVGQNTSSTKKEKPSKSAAKKDSFGQRKSSIKTPFGTIDIDSTDKGMAFEEFDQKYGGKVMTRKKGRKAKPRRRAALRGHRAEQRGG